MAINSKVAIDVQIKNVQKITDLKNSLKELRKEQRDIEKATKEGNKSQSISSKRYKDNAKAIDGKSKSLRGLNRSQKDATKSSGSLTKSFIKGAAAVGIIIGAFRAVSRMLSSVVSVFTEFEFVMAKVNAVSGATEKEFAALTKTAEELGRTTFFTATQVGELMLNFSKLGFTANEIQDAVQPTLDLATATGSDLARAALVAGAAVRGFGLDASETQRVVDVMAVSFSSSAMNIEKWQTSMTKVAPIAKSAGFSIEDTAAIMSKLTDSGIEASIAGTSLRNILLKMQDPSSDLTKSFGRTIHGLDDLVPAMKGFVEEGGSMADVMEVVDLRQAAAFEQMLTSADSTVELRNALLDANGEGERMALIIGDTLQGAMLKLTSATQGFAISFMENFSGSIQKGVESAAEFFNKITESAAAIAKLIKGLIMVAKFMGLYKTVQIATNASIVAYEMITGTATIATVRFKAAFARLTAVMMANPYVAVGALLIALATDLFNLRNNVTGVDDSWAAMNKTIKGDIAGYETRQKIIESLKGELATVQDLQRAKIAMTRIDEEVAARLQSTVALEIQLRKNATEMFGQHNEGMIETYVARGLADQEQNIRLKQSQKLEIQSAVAIAQKTIAVQKSTEVIEENTKATKDNFDAEAEIIALLMNNGVRSKEEEARVMKHLNDERVKEINLQLKSLNQFVMAIGLRKKLLAELASLTSSTAKSEETLDVDAQKRKDDLFKSDVKRAIMSGQTAQEAMKTVVRAQIMEAVAGFIASVFKTVPFPFNLIVAAGASAVVGGVIDKQLANFGDGGVVEEFAKGGMVHGASHANGGVKFADGGLMSSPAFAESQFNANSQSQMLNAMGGQQKVVVVEADITDSQSTVSVIQANATF